MYGDLNGRSKIGTIGMKFEVTGRLGDYLTVTIEDKKRHIIEGKKGYIYAPKLSQKTNEVVSFSSGMIRFIRREQRQEPRFNRRGV